MESIELPELTPQVVMSTLFLGLVVRSLVAPPTSSPGATTLTLVRSPFSTVAHAVAQLKLKNTQQLHIQPLFVLDAGPPCKQSFHSSNPMDTR